MSKFVQDPNGSGLRLLILQETEGSLFVAQEQALSTNAIKAHVYRMSCALYTCRLCSVHDGTVDHLVRGCSFLSQCEHKKRHDKVAGFIHVHWKLSETQVLWYLNSGGNTTPTKLLKILITNCCGILLY